MSRYNEDWQRRKAYLIRSLFNDIPYRVLSPVVEESNSSTNAQDLEKSEQSLTSSEDQIVLDIEPSVPTNTVQNITSPPVPDFADGDRPCSPLPPLIIAREPNRHDEPPEYYDKLLIKMKKIYKKMFLEGKQLSDDDFIENDYEQNSLTDKSNLNNGSSFNSNGYTADDESIDSDYSNNEHNRSKLIINESLNNINLRNDIIDNGLKSIVNNDIDINTELPDEDMHLDSSDYSNNEHNRSKSIINESLNNRNLQNDIIDNGLESIVNNDIDINTELPDEDMHLDSSVPNEEPNYSQITIAADVHIDGQPPPEITPSPIYGEQPTEVTSSQDKILMTQEESNKQLRDSSQRTSFQTIPVSDNDISERVTSQFECTELLQQDSLMEQAHEFDESHLFFKNPFEPDQRLEVSQCLISDHRSKSPVLECRKLKQQRKRAIVSSYDGTDEALEDYPAATSNQVTLQAEVVTEIPQRDSTVEVLQNAPAKMSCSLSSDLRFQRSERELTMLEDLQDPETTVPIEVMRTPRQADTSLESIPGGNTRLTSSDMDFTYEHNPVLHDISNMTSQSQDGGYVKGTTDQKISVDFDDVMAFSFNNSNHMSRQSTENINANKPSSTRKRRHETISVQTEKVTWNDLRADFFMGTPKIFKLCTCVDHNCR